MKKNNYFVQKNPTIKVTTTLLTEIFSPILFLIPGYAQPNSRANPPPTNKQKNTFFYKWRKFTRKLKYDILFQKEVKTSRSLDYFLNTRTPVVLMVLVSFFDLIRSLKAKLREPLGVMRSLNISH